LIHTPTADGKIRQKKIKATEGEKMTGENFLRINRPDEHLKRMLSDLDELRDKWSEEYHKQDRDGNYIFNIDNMYKIEEKIKKLKYYIYTYYYNRHTIEEVRAFTRKYLW
jgi:hypothetical protein